MPPAPAAGPASSTGPATPPAGDAAREQDGRPRVLVAEDSKVNQRMTSRMLGRLGCAADVVESGLEVLAAIERTPYAAVLMDCQMPMMDGFEARTEIRHRERREAVAGIAAHLPIIALTANAPESDRQRCLAVRMDDFLPKPLRTDRLAAALKQWAGEPEPADAAAADSLDREEDAARVAPTRRERYAGPAPAPDPGPSRDAPGPIDPSAVEGIRALQPGIVSELVDLFLAGAPPADRDDPHGRADGLVRAAVPGGPHPQGGRGDLGRHGAGAGLRGDRAEPAGRPPDHP